MLLAATVLTVLIAVSVVLMGARAFQAPQAAVGFGIPDTPTDHPGFRSWLAVKAVRDIASGLTILLLLGVAEPDVVGWVVLVATVIPVGDAVIVRRSSGPASAVYGIHGVTAAVMLATGLLLVAV